MTGDATREPQKKRSVFHSLKVGLLAGLIFGAGYFVAKATITIPPSKDVGTSRMSEKKRLELAQAKYEEIQKRLQLRYYQELTSKSQPASEKTAKSPIKKPKIKGEKPSSDNMAKALAKVLGKSTPESVSDAVQTKLPTQTGSAYAVQVASLMDRKAAEELTNKLIVKGYAAKLLQAELPGRGLVYRVRIHGFQSKDEADKARYKISKKENMEAITVSQKDS